MFITGTFFLSRVLSRAISRPKAKETIPIGEAQLDPKLYSDFSLAQLVTSFKLDSDSWSGDDTQFRNLIQAALSKDASKRYLVFLRHISTLISAQLPVNF